MQNLDQKRKRIELGVKLAAIGVIGFFVAPFVFVAVKGIVGLALAAGVGVIGINLAPWFSAKVANWRLKAIKHEASKNPIETLENEYAARTGKLGEYKKSLESFSASVTAYKSKLATVKKDYPNDVESYEEQYEKMKKLFELRAWKYKEAYEGLENFKKTINKAKIMWDLGQEAAKMSQAAGMGDEEILAQIKTETALDCVQKGMDMAFAELEISLLDEGQAPKAAIADGINTTDKQTERKKIQI